jgi:hypothetical protein
MELLSDLWTDGETSKSGTQKLPKKFKIVETYGRDHSLESSWRALSDAMISFSIQPFPGKYIF